MTKERMIGLCNTLESAKYALVTDEQAEDLEELREYLLNNLNQFDLQVVPKIAEDEESFLHFVMKLLQEYWDKNNNGKAMVYVKNDETGQTFAYTRGEYSQMLIDFIKALPLC